MNGVKWIAIGANSFFLFCDCVVALYEQQVEIESCMSVLLLEPEVIKRAFVSIEKCTHVWWKTKKKY